MIWEEGGQGMNITFCHLPIIENGDSTPRGQAGRASKHLRTSSPHPSLIPSYPTTPL